jgi:hypothetical protein
MNRASREVALFIRLHAAPSVAQCRGLSAIWRLNARIGSLLVLNQYTTRKAIGRRVSA